MELGIRSGLRRLRAIVTYTQAGEEGGSRRRLDRIRVVREYDGEWPDNVGVSE